MANSGWPPRLTTKSSVKSDREAAVVLVEGNRKGHRPCGLVDCRPGVHGRQPGSITAADAEGGIGSDSRSGSWVFRVRVWNDCVGVAQKP